MTNGNIGMKKEISKPALYQQLDESSWMMTPPGAHRKRLGELNDCVMAAYCG